MHYDYEKCRAGWDGANCKRFYSDRMWAVWEKWLRVNWLIYSVWLNGKEFLNWHFQNCKRDETEMLMKCNYIEEPHLVHLVPRYWISPFWSQLHRHKIRIHHPQIQVEKFMWMRTSLNNHSKIFPTTSAAYYIFLQT